MASRPAPQPPPEIGDQMMQLAISGVEPFVHEYFPYTRGFGTQAFHSGRDAKRNWDMFYRDNRGNFFKDRHYLLREFAEPSEDGREDMVVLEVGCGAGNSVYPLLDSLQKGRIYCCDFAKNAVQLVRENPKFDPERVFPFQHDLTAGIISNEILGDHSVDYCLVVFVLSAIPKAEHADAVANLGRKMAPGGLMYFRDYAVSDLAQERLRVKQAMRDDLARAEMAEPDENMLVRGDGTLSYFFSPTYVANLFQHCGFTVLMNEEIKRTVTNNREGLHMERTWVHAKLRWN